jgi:hypothetical protein
MFLAVGGTESASADEEDERLFHMPLAGILGSRADFLRKKHIQVIEP